MAGLTSPPHVSIAEILFVIGQLDVGGTEKHLAMLAPALVREGWRVSVFSLGGNGLVGEELANAGVAVILPTRRASRRGPFGRILSLSGAAFDLLKVLRRRRPSVVHFFLPAAYLVGAPLAVLAGVPKLIMSRRSQNLYQRSYPLVRQFERFLHRAMSAVLGNSLRVVEELRDEGVPEVKIGLVYNGVDAERFVRSDRDDARAALRVESDELLLVTVANLIPYKGHADILAALDRAKSALPARWRMLFVGRDDGVGAELRALAGSYGLEAHVAFLGSRTDIPQLLAASDIGLLCSHEEGFSNALLEGMAAGLPFIATDVGGNAEAVRHRESGIIVPPRDPARIASALIELAHDADFRQRLGAAARLRVEREFSMSRCVQSYDALYRGLLAGKQPIDLPSVSVDRALQR